MFHYTVETAKTIQQVIQDLEQSLKSRKFGVLWAFDLTATLHSKGIEFTKPYHILEVCNPVRAKEVLSEDDLVGYFLPCKIVVYDDGGVTKIGLPRPTALMKMIERPALQPIAQIVEQTLISAIDEAK